MLVSYCKSVAVLNKVRCGVSRQAGTCRPSAATRRYLQGKKNKLICLNDSKQQKTIVAGGNWAENGSY